MISLELDSSASLCSDADLFAFGATETAHSERLQRLENRPCFRLPEQQLDQYVKRRGSSDLGRVFHVANGLHEHIDAIVVLGSRRSTLAFEGLMQACCDPYHNELSRAQRGCKPRVYFAGDGYDNDATASLLERLRAADDETSQAERRFAILIHLDDQAEPAIAALPPFVECLRRMSPDRTDSWLSRLVVPIVHKGVSVEQGCAGIQPKFTFELDRDLRGESNALSTATLLPAAFLGLDCMKLLEGAVAMNTHFGSAPCQQNLVRRYESIIRCWAAKHPEVIPSIRVWEHSLRSLQQWGGSLNPHAETNPAQPPCTIHWRVRSHRTDPVILADKPGQTYHDQLHWQINRFNRSMQSSGYPTIDLTLPIIEPYTLGQLIQMTIITADQQAVPHGFADATRTDSDTATLEEREQVS
ncbi:hypothetical protein [Neorhodopirellula pilleata]|uniref:Glucose-6-phosphate isomerase n=1 Tax=Neorhodopirellula pilleata TaxID=2714738 RepID=A0A5C5ZFS4_9BACT|nr:hypothetical protein [Neorhodopirellula pilleata]TWT86056.1 Glucose-6-phosphate isomerase [Neorhodopirellula pilleata]